MTLGDAMRIDWAASVKYNVWGPLIRWPANGKSDVFVNTNRQECLKCVCPVFSDTMKAVRITVLGEYMNE